MKDWKVTFSHLLNSIVHCLKEKHFIKEGREINIEKKILYVMFQLKNRTKKE